MLLKKRIENKKSFSLAEILIALVIVIFVILGAGSAHIGAHNFFTSIKQHSQVQDEVRIAMEHIAKNIQNGIGESTTQIIYDSGRELRVNIDTGDDGRFDKTISYTYLGAPNYRIVYDPDIGTAGNERNITDDLISSVSFSVEDVNTPNEITIEIKALSDPTKTKAIDNPEASLTSTIAIKGMSCR